MKKTIAILLSAILLVTLLVGCSAGDSDDGNTVTGKITSLSGSKVSLNIGTLSQGGFGGKGERPTNENGEQAEKPSGEIPSGFDGERPQMPNGEIPTDENGEKISMPDGEMPSGFDGERPQMPDGEMPSGDFSMPEGGFSADGKEDIQMFIAGDETISLDLSGVTINQDGEKKSVSDLKVGDVITLTYNSKGALKKAEIIQVFSGFNGNFKGMPVEKPTE